MNESPIYIIGKGNLGWHLNVFFNENRVKVGGWLSSRINFEELNLPSDSLIFLAVSDDAVEPILKNLLANNNKLIIIYCSGTLNLVSKYPNNTANWYPLYSFTKNIPVQWNKIPIFLEFKEELIGERLEILNLELGVKAKIITTDQRNRIHLAAVFINNFTNACAIAAQQSLNDSELFSYLMPILNQTVEKITHYSGDIIDLQTGPARRQDQLVIQKHLELLKFLVPESEVYSEMNKYIQQKIQ